MPTLTRVGILGASGETGGSIVTGLLEAGRFEIIALTRPTSLSKPINQTLQSRGVTLRPIDLSGAHSALVTAVSDLQILISAISPMDFPLQIPLATAAKTAGVSRFLPCAYVSIIPPGGISDLIDAKQPVYNHMKQIRLPYTIVDVGWWYQLVVPRVPSGRTDYVQLSGKANEVVAGGNTPSALTDLRDVGRWIARVVGDERTVNKYVFVWNEVRTQKEMFEVVEEISGEEVERKDVTEEELREVVERAPSGGLTIETLAQKVPAQYLISLYVRGDNQPKYAKYLGYLDGKELYPDFKPRSFKEYVQEVLDGKAKGVYEGRYADLKKHFSK